MGWWSTAPVFVAALAIMFGPGLVVGLSAQLRGFKLVYFAAPISVSVVSLSAIAAPWVGLKWSPIPVVLMTLGVSLFGGLAAWLARVGSPNIQPKDHWAQWRSGLSAVTAVIIAAILIGRRLIYVFGTPDSLSQTFDNIFHLNAVRYILDTGNASSFFVSTLTGGGFYPAAWHDIVALVALPGTEITLATNIVNLVAGSVVWPVSMIALTQAFVGARPAALWLAAIFSTGFGAFPILLLDFGVLYPNFLGYALLPAILALLVWTVRIGAAPGLRPWVGLFLLLVALPGLALAHPNSLMTLLAVSIPVVLITWARWWRSLRGQGSARVLAASVLVVGVSAFVAGWWLVRPPAAAATWGPVETLGQAIGELIALSGIGRAPTWLPAILALVGIVWAARSKENRWFLGVYAAIGLLFVVVAGAPFGSVRSALTGVYYNDPPRLAALLPLIGIPLAVAGGLWTWEWLTLRLRKHWMSAHLVRMKVVAPAMAVAVIVLSIVAVQTGSIRDAARSAAGNYQINPQAALISTDEMALLKRLDSETPSNAVIVGNPWNGSSLAYALADRRVAQPHILGEVPPGLPTVYDHLRDAKTDSTVCEAVKRLHIDYVLDFGHQEVHGGNHGVTGLDNLTQSGVAQLVDQQGQAKLLRITACGNQG